MSNLKSKIECGDILSKATVELESIASKTP